MADVNINTGVVIEVSAALPATFDSTTYAALAWTVCGEVVDVGEIAKTWATLTHQAVTRAYPVKLKDTYDIADVSLNLARVAADAGQVILKTALDSVNSYSFQLTLPSAEIVYFTGKVTKAGHGSIASGSVESMAVSIAIDPESLVEA